MNFEDATYRHCHYWQNPKFGLVAQTLEPAMEEESLPASNESQLFYEAFKASPVGIAFEDLEGRPLFVNPALCSMLGFSQEEMLGKRCVEFSPPKDAQQDWALFEQLRAGSIDHYHLDKRFFRKDGSLAWGRLSASLLTHHTPPMVLVLVQDLTEKKKVQEELQRLQEEEHRALKTLEMVTEQMAGAVTQASRDFRYLWANKGYAEWLQLPLDHIVGRPVADVLGKEAFETLRPYFERVLTGQKVHYEQQVNYQYAGPKWISATYTPTFDETGVANGWVAVVTDITERKRATDWNKGAEELYGYAAGEAIGKPISLLVPPECSDDFPRNMGSVKRGETVKNYETLRQRKDGTCIHVSLTVSPFRDSEGRVAGTSAIARDISERKQQEEALHQKDRELSEAQRIAGIGSWTWSARNDVVTWSEELYRIAGRDPMLSPPSYKEHSSLFAAGSWERLSRCVDEALRDGTSFELDVEMVRPDGSTRWITTRGEAVADPTGLVVGVRGTAQDITERKQADEAIARLSGRLIEAQEEERSRIARELHDDVGQRLAVLSWGLQQLHTELPPDAPAFLSEQLDSTLGQASEISNEVRNLSHRLHSSHLDLRGLVAAMESFCREFAKQQNVEIDFTHGDLPKNIPQDVSLCLFRILQEGLHNAVKYSGVQRFEIGLQPVPDGVQLVIRDSGVGFDVQAAMKKQGLGLVSMRERVSLVKGTLTIESKPTKGTVIKVRIPLASKAKAATGA
jgi:PAS domain S-box-containing protein